MPIDIRQTAINLWAVWVLTFVFGFFILQMFKKILNKFLDTFTGKLDEIIIKLDKVWCKIWKTLLSKEETIEIFTLILSEHICKKLEFLRWILVENSIHKRRPQIEKNIRSKIVEITQEEASKLSKYNSPAWDLGDMLMTVDFNKFCKDINEIFFSEDEIDNKVSDLKRMMWWYVNDLITKINWEIKSREF